MSGKSLHFGQSLKALADTRRRLETRVGAEEVIERLHGRMVRGWNDTGSRISVRFADTSEQRELRVCPFFATHFSFLINSYFCTILQRTERATQEGDGSPARLTIAQAALLNLRGQELRSTKTGSVIHAHTHTGSRIPSTTSSRGGFPTSFSAPDFNSDYAGLNNVPVIGSGSGGELGGLEVDYSLAPGRSAGLGVGIDQRARSPYHGHLGYPQQHNQYPSQLGLGHALSQTSVHNPNVSDPSMAALLDSMRANGVPYHGAGDEYGIDDYGLQNQRIVSASGHQQRGLQGQHHHQSLPMSQSLDNLQQYGRPSPAYTRSGYTTTEEYIMRAHAENAALARAQAEVQLQQQATVDRRRPAPLNLRRRRMEDGIDETVVGANIAVGVRGYRAQASLMSPLVTSSSLGSGISMSDFGSLQAIGGVGMRGGGMDINEEVFQAGTASSALGSFGLGEDRSITGSIHASRHTGGLNSSFVAPRTNARLLREPDSAPASTSAASYQQLQRPMPLSPLIPTYSNEDAASSPNPHDPILAYQQHHASAAHMRSTTLPQHRSSSIRDRERGGQQQEVQQHAGRGHQSHNSLSMPAQNFRTPQHASVAKLAGVGMEGQGGTIYENDGPEDQQQQRMEGVANSLNATNSNGNGNARPSSNIGPLKTHYSANIFGEMDQSSPISASSSLISPTLTYSSQTPSTLSPATPFFGSFNSQTDGFEKPAGSVEQQ